MHKIYYLFCSLTGALVYIGRSPDPEKRRRDHQRRLGRPLNFGECLFQRFRYLADAAVAERAAILRHRPELNKRVASSFGSWGQPASAESRRKQSIARRGKPRPSLQGVKQSPEHVEKGRQARLGKPRSAETKAKIAAGNTGKKFTPERIENIRLAQQARRALERANSTTN